ncbi:MAG TPA: 5'-nucleotidase C-terminal domain-containing protein [Candidatus Limnocylindrales bacterium]|nr:5'-nucleotidase C-terminal domain-containing protein [Candidatus Limnocylindrales bacterium]
MKRLQTLVLLAIVALAAPLLLVPAPVSAAGPIEFAILHTNDFHGQLEASGSNPGLARVAAVANAVRTTEGADNVLLVDAGDAMQGSLLSNIQKGAPTIAAFEAMGYDVATFGNHEFDWGQAVLGNRTLQATQPYVSANIVAGTCDAANWTTPSFVDAPYVVETVGTAPDEVKVAFIGVTTQETPTITIAAATAGLCFKDPFESIAHYYPAMQAAADVIVVMSHLGYPDGGYGYGIPVYGDQTLAKKLNDAGKPVALIIGGHSHTNLSAATMVGSTAVVQAYYNGRRLGRADITFEPASEATTVTWQSLAVPTTGAGDPAVSAVVQAYASDPAYLALINQPVGYVQTDLLRNYNGDSMMGDFVDDAIYGALNSDATTANDVDLFLNNAGGIRADWCDKPDPGTPGAFVWSGDPADCASGLWAHDPMLLTYGQTFSILPFGNATVVGKMTGAEILQVLNQSATLAKGAIQPAGLRYTFYRYADTKPGPQPWAWGAYDACVVNRTTGACEPLDLDRTYRVGTNEFLAPAGQDGYLPFKYMTDITYWGDMLDAVNLYVSTHYTAANPYRGPTGNGQLDGRITRDGTDAAGSVIPITILHHNDSHGNLAKGTFVGFTQLATLIRQERLHNPERTILVNGGDQIQGDAMMYFFKTSATGAASDGTPLPEALQTNPMIAVMNALDYDAMTLGNHEFNFGSDVFTGVFGQAEFPLLGANIADDGRYGLSEVGPGGEGVQPYVTVTVDGIDVAILGISNHRVPNYELPSNIVGLTFSNPITTAEAYADQLRPKEDIVVALTHIGFTTNPKSVEVDDNVDTNLARNVAGIDAIVGAHSHTNPASPEAPYKFLPSIVGGPGNTPVIINQAYRYNNTLGEVILGVRPKMTMTLEDLAAFCASGAIDRPDLCTGLRDRLTVAQSKYDAGATKAATNVLNAFIATIKAQSGKHISTAAADALIADAMWMISHEGGHQVVTRTGQYLSVPMTTPEDPEIKAIVDPYVAALATYNNGIVGQTTAPIDALQAFTTETNAANLQADASVWELEDHGIDVDFHLSGAMTNRKVADGATPSSPVTLKVSDMFSLMPYENSLVVLRMNGPQLKAVLERAYRNFYYYKYVPGYGGYSYYTTCMLDTNAGNVITYDDTYPAAYDPSVSHVLSLSIGGTPVDFTDATTFYRVSTVNYLAAGSCNFNDAGVSLWPLSQIANDTQYYVRDAVIDYVRDQSGPISPAIEGRLVFN